MASAGDPVEKLLKRLAAEIEAQGIRVDMMYLFGSRVGREARADSDIDVAVISPDFRGAAMPIWIQVMRTCFRVDPRIEPVLYAPEEFRDEEPLAWEIKRTGRQIVLAPPPLVTEAN